MTKKNSRSSSYSSSSALSSLSSLSSSKSWHNNPTLLYAIFVVTVAFLVHCMVHANTKLIVLYFLFALVARGFSHNMIFVLSAALCGLVLILLIESKNVDMFEGMKNKNNNNNNQKRRHEKKEHEIQKKKYPMGVESSRKTSHAKGASKSSHIDYASTVQSAYGNLKNILDSDSLGKLTADTKQLVDQQKSLAGTMESLAPLMANAQTLMQQFKDTKDSTNMASNAAGGLDMLAEQMNIPTQKA